MSPAKIVLDAEALSKLTHVPDGSEICDSTGQTLAVVISPESYRHMRAAMEQFVYDEAVAQRAEEDYRAGRTRSTAEVLEYLKSL